MELRIHNPWAGGRMTVDTFWIAGGRRYCSGFVLGLFCSISHDSTFRRKSWTDPTIHSQVFVFVLARGGCWRGAAPSNVCVAGPPVRALRIRFPLMRNFWAEQLPESIEVLYRGFPTQMAVPFPPKWPWIPHPNGRGKLFKLSGYPPWRCYTYSTQMAVVFGQCGCLYLSNFRIGGALL